MSRSAPRQDRQRRSAARCKDSIAAKLQEARKPGIRVVEVDGIWTRAAKTREPSEARVFRCGGGLNVANKRLSPTGTRRCSLSVLCPGLGARPTVPSRFPRFAPLLLLSFHHKDGQGAGIAVPPHAARLQNQHPDLA